MKAKNGAQGFTLLEIMIAVAIIALIAMFAMPSFKKAHEATVEKLKKNNARLLASAALEWATVANKNNSAAVSKADLEPYIRRGWDGLKIGKTDAVFPGSTIDYYDQNDLDTIMDDMYP